MTLTLDEIDQQLAETAQLMQQALTSNCLDIYDKYADRRDQLLDARSILMAARDRACPYGDPCCPCQDGDACHYEGPDAWPPPHKHKEVDPS